MMNIYLLALVTTLSIYHGCSTWKTISEENITGEEKSTLGYFTAVNMKIVVVVMLGNTEI